jgi:hypothetical protein
MGQPPNPDPDKDEEDLEALGTPFYQGTGLSVRALTAEELEQFLDAHADQPTELLGSGWAALDRRSHPLTVPRTPPGAAPAPPQPQPVLPASRSPAAWATPVAPPSSSTGAAAPPSSPDGPAACPGGPSW